MSWRVVLTCQALKKKHPAPISKQMAECIFCQIAAGNAPAKIVYQDEHLVAFRDRAPKAAIHLLVITRKHIRNLDDLQMADADLISHLMMTLPRIARENGLTDGYRTVTNTGRGGRQEVCHIHFHLMGGGKLPAI
ncbi:histidine triad nucleotide-binding protein [Pontibacterium granulatum]|uniref:histidine triad nucleotide-binding protein n=1 Tax=Pontibacterium granulatum TaxID=2036029 RepID=UPI0031F2DAB5